MVRSVQHNEPRDSRRTAQNTPTPWDTQTVQDHPRTRDGSDSQGRPQSQQQHHDPRDSRQRESSHSRERSERMRSMSRQHMRNDSGTTGVASSGDYADTHNPTGRRHDYDVQSMETSLSSPRGLLKNPIPAPTVTVRSEFPTLNRSRQQQSLTCLVTVEVLEGKWRPDPEDMRSVPPVPSVHPSENYGRSKSPAPSRAFEQMYESPEALDEITEDLHSRVDNWHGLDFSRYNTPDNYLLIFLYFF